MKSAGIREAQPPEDVVTQSHQSEEDEMRGAHPEERKELGPRQGLAARVRACVWAVGKSPDASNKIQLRAVDHSARGSMKNAASCVN